jgi:quinol monooxygenase YgiN
MIHVIARFTAKPGMRDNILAAAREIRPMVLVEKGCIEYNLVVDTPDNPFQKFGPDTMLFLEKWEDMAALQAHAACAHTQGFFAKAKDWTESSAIHVLEAA